MMRRTLWVCCAAATSAEATSSSATSEAEPQGTKFQIAIVGSGPSGCYAADHLLKKCGNAVHIDIYDRMPVPFGLVRYGVAPDHPEVKNVEDRFLKMLKEEKDRVTWLGNIDVGRYLSVRQMTEAYHAVIYATGAYNDNKLGIPFEDLANVFSARTFVNYYNTMPAPYANSLACPFDMTKTRRAVIIGNGNVALDIARALAAPYQHWCPTDMNCRAVRDLMNSEIEEIDIIARRGEEHAAFTTAEFREIATIFSSHCVEVRLRDFDLEEALKRSDGSRARKRMLELMHKYTDSSRAAAAAEAKAKAEAEAANVEPGQQQEGDASPSEADETSTLGPNQRKMAEAQPFVANAFIQDRKEVFKTTTAMKRAYDAGTAADAAAGGSNAEPTTPVRKRVVNFYFNLKPTRFVPRRDRRNYVGGVQCALTDPLTGHVRDTIVVPADVVLTSIGYRSDPVRGLPFDDKKGIIPNVGGRVCSSAEAAEAVRNPPSPPPKEGEITLETEAEIAAASAGTTTGDAPLILPNTYCVGWVKRGPRGVILHAMMDAQDTANKVIEDLKIPVKDSRKKAAADAAEGTSAPPPTSTTLPAVVPKAGKFELLDYLVAKQIIPVSLKGALRIFAAEKEKGTDLGKRLEKIGSVSHMVDVAIGGAVGEKAAKQFRGIANVRGPGGDMMGAFLDEETDMRHIAKGFAKTMPHVTGNTRPFTGEGK